MREAHDEDSGLWASLGAALRLLVGWFSVVIGLLNLLVEADRVTGAPDVAYLLFHVVLVTGGAVLLATPAPASAANGAAPGNGRSANSAAPGNGRSANSAAPGNGRDANGNGRHVGGAALGGVVAVGGMIAGAVPVTTSVCCLSAFTEPHGYPFSFLARDGGRWHLDGHHLVVDLLFWAYAGLLVLASVALVRRLTGHRAATPTLPPAHPDAPGHPEAPGHPDTPAHPDAAAHPDTAAHPEVAAQPDAAAHSDTPAHLAAPPHPHAEPRAHAVEQTRREQPADD